MSAAHHPALDPAEQASETDQRHRSAQPIRRKDAARNRQKIVAAARSVLVAHGFGADMRTFAREAGVGIGTLYRHFPSREHLINEILDPDLAALIRIRLPPNLPAAAALERYARALIPQIAANRCLIEILTRADAADPELDLFLAHLRTVGAEALARSAHDQTLVPGITPDDIAYHILALVRIIQLTRAVSPDPWEHHLTLTLSALTSSKWPTV
jgi:AcrR family transcriptional regulator